MESRACAFHSHGHTRGTITEGLTLLGRSHTHTHPGPRAGCEALCGFRGGGTPGALPVQSHNDKGGGGGLFPVDLSVQTANT